MWVANKHMKKCSMLSAVWERQMKTMRYHSMPIRMTKILKWAIGSAAEHMEELEFSYVIGENAKWHSHSRKQFVFIKLRITYSMIL